MGMNNRVFANWLKTFRASINEYDYYIDFDKVYQNAEQYKIEINILNSLVGSKAIEEDFSQIVTKYPECLKVIPLFLAVRGKEIYCQDEQGAVNYRFDKKAQSIEQYQYFMRQTGLFDMLQNHIISNLYDYVTGVEVGLDSNGRKNRGGKQMEFLVESYLKKAGVDYYPQMELTEIEKRWDMDLSAISAQGTAEKRWDFVVKTEKTVFAIETNFYASGGSKLNEVARSYKMIAEEAKNIVGFQFVWITDGGGWNKAKGNLKETFSTMEHLYNITDMEDDIFHRIFQ
jgi:type II restriction enzyme